MRVHTKRVYDAPDPADGLRVLIDRLWPRGLSKTDAAVDLWAKDNAPSHELRKWYAHDPAKRDAFIDRYHAELDAAPDAWASFVDQLTGHDTVTLLTATKDLALSHAPVLRAELMRSD